MYTHQIHAPDTCVYMSESVCVCPLYRPTQFRYARGAFLCEGSLGVFARRSEAAVVLSHAVDYSCTLKNRIKKPRRCR